MSTPQIPDIPIKRKRGRPRKEAIDLTTEQEAEVKVSEPMAPVCIAQEVEATPLRSALMLDQVAEVKPSKRKYGTRQEVYDGLYQSTRSGLTKDDLVKTVKGKIVSQKQLKALEIATERIRKPSSSVAV